MVLIAPTFIIGVQTYCYFCSFRRTQAEICQSALFQPSFSTESPLARNLRFLMQGGTQYSVEINPATRLNSKSGRRKIERSELRCLHQHPFAPLKHSHSATLTHPQAHTHRHSHTHEDTHRPRETVSHR